MTLIPGHWTAALINHLWQSTAFAAVAWLLALALRRNQARARYWLWMIASVKFLLPFSLLIMVGGYLRPAITVPMTKPAISAAIEKVAQPFSPIQFSVNIATTNVLPTVVAHNASPIPLLLFGVWLCGFLMLAFSWGRKWKNIRAVVRTASPVALVADVPVMSSSALLEPGVFGIFRPVLLLPEGITERLTEPQLETILSHEMWHVRRRDNLTAAIHMLVEMIFWFHPFVWWIRTRLMEERERACDEAVLQAGGEGQIYAEGILNVCKFYVESPLACVSGVTGSDLKKRIVRIMTEQVARKLDFRRRLLLASAGVLAVALPITFGLIHTTQIRAQAAAPAKADQGIVGDWQGTIHAPDHDWRTVLKITEAKPGKLAVVLYSIDQGGQPLPATSASFKDGVLQFAIEFIDGSYDGKMSADGKSIVGAWKQGPKPQPFVSERATPETAWAIPAPPRRMPPMAADANPSFEVATIKPSKPGQQGQGFLVRGDQFTTINTSLMSIIEFAYDMQANQVVGGPPWITSDKFDIAGKPDTPGAPSDKQWKGMIKKLLADRFQLKFHQQSKEMPAYVLTVAKNGPKLTKSDGDPNGLPGLFFHQLGQLYVRNATMEDFTHLMQAVVLDRPVVDQTGIKNRWDFVLKWTPDDSQFGGMGVKAPPPSNAADAPPPLFTAIQEQIGLKLEAKKAPVEIMVIDHVEKPSAN